VTATAADADALRGEVERLQARVRAAEGASEAAHVAARAQVPSLSLSLALSPSFFLSLPPLVSLSPLASDHRHCSLGRWRRSGIIIIIVMIVTY